MKNALAATIAITVAFAAFMAYDIMFDGAEFLAKLQRMF